MSNLVLELRQGEVMIVNGAPIRFRTKSRIELTAKARFLFGKQIMQADDALTPARKIYFALQQAYIGDEATRPEALGRARALIETHRATAAQPLADALAHMLCVIAHGAGFEALKLARQIIREEQAKSLIVSG